MGNGIADLRGTENMVNDEDVKTLHGRIDNMTSKFEKCNGEVVEKLNKLLMDVALITKTCEHRGKSCATHVCEIDTMLRGNGRKGVLVRLEALEQCSTGKEKFSWFVIGILGTGSVSLVIAMLMRLFGS
jgi:hypothetical protein